MRILRARMRGHTLPVACILIVTLGFFIPRFYGYTYSAVAHYMSVSYPWMGADTPRMPYPSLIQLDHAETFYPLTAFGSTAWKRGEIPLWYPYNFGGFPILELGMTNLLYPPRILLSYVFDPPRQQDLMTFLHLLLAGLGMYGLLRVWGANAQGSVVGGVLWELSGNNTLSLPLGHITIAAAWCPVMLFSAALAVRRRSYRWAVAAGAATGIALYSGAIHAVYLSGLLMALWYGIETCQAAWTAWHQAQKRAAIIHLMMPAVSLAVTLIVSLAFWLPLLRILPDVSRQPQSLELQLALWHTWRDIVGSPQTVSYSFTGLTGLLLAVCGVLLKRSKHVSLALAVLILTVTALRGVPWWVKVLRQVPFFATITLYELFFLLAFSVAVLAGFGLSELIEGWKKGSRSFPVVAIGVIGCVGLVEVTTSLWAYKQTYYLLSVMPLVDRFSSKATLRFFLIIAVVLGAAAMVGWTKRRSGERIVCWRAATGYAVVLLVASVLSLHAWLILPQHLAYRDWFFPETPLITHLKSRLPESRLLPVYHHTEPESEYIYFGKTPFMLPGKTPSIFDLRSGSGYESLLPARTQSLWRIVQRGGKAEPLAKMSLSFKPVFFHDRLPLNLLEKLSIGWLVTPPQVEPQDSFSGQNLVGNAALRLAYQGKDGWIYEDPHALKRVFLVPQVTHASDETQALRTLTDPSFDARLSVLVEGGLTAPETELLRTTPTEPFPSDAARILRESLNEVEIETSSARAGVLVLNDSWADGWRATVDGIEQPVYRVNYNSRGLVLSEGNHRIVFQYRPVLLLASMAISAAALLLVIAWFTAGLIRRLWHSDSTSQFNGPVSD